eukprot:577276-Amphidinium_carterae.1
MHLPASGGVCLEDGDVMRCIAGDWPKLELNGGFCKLPLNFLCNSGLAPVSGAQMPSSLEEFFKSLIHSNAVGFR